MNTDNNSIRREEGMGMVMAMIFVSVAIIAVGSLFMRGANLNRQIGEYLEGEDSMYPSDNPLSANFDLSRKSGNERVGPRPGPGNAGRLARSRLSSGGTLNTLFCLLSDAFGTKNPYDKLLIDGILSRLGQW